MYLLILPSANFPKLHYLMTCTLSFISFTFLIKDRLIYVPFLIRLFFVMFSFYAPCFFLLFLPVSSVGVGGDVPSFLLSCVSLKIT